MEDRFGSLFALSQLITYCVIPDQYSFPVELTESIELSQDGRQFADQQIGPGHPVSAIKVALLGLWGNGDAVFVDVDKTDMSTLEQQLHQEILVRRVQYPWIFGRWLHDAYVKQYGVDAIALSAEASQRLLQNGPQGVVQQREYVAGPFGLLKSKEFRQITMGGVPLLCADPSCRAVHAAMLATGETAAASTFRKGAQASRMSTTLSRASQRSLQAFEDFWIPRNRADLPWLLGNGLTLSELRTVVAALINSDQSLRKLIIDIDSRWRKASSRQICDALDHASLLQLALVSSDGVLESTLDELVLSGDLPISPTEVRLGRLRQGMPRAAFGTRAQLGALGVRYQPTGIAPVEHAILVVGQVYDGRDQELAWQLRALSGVGWRNKLEGALDRESPREVLHRLLFATSDTLRQSSEILGLSGDNVVASLESEEALLSRMLWKLGFPEEPPAAIDGSVRNQIFELQQVSAGQHVSQDARMRQVRSVGTELFVACEALFSRAVEFVTWALFEDHFLRDRHERFSYAEEVARSRANQIFSSRNRNGFQWSTSGRNALGTLVTAFVEVSELLNEAIEVESPPLRPIDQLPEYATHSNVIPFPFRHRVPLFDLRRESVTHMITSLHRINQLLTQGMVVDVRNRLSHNRPDEFPTPDEIDAAARSLTETLDELSLCGFLPTVFAMIEDRRDRFGRRVVTLKSGAADTVTLRSPERFSSAGMPSGTQDQMIFKGAILADGSEPLRFAVRHDGLWARYWQGLDSSDERDVTNSARAASASPIVE